MATKKKRVRKRATVRGDWLRAARTHAGVTQAELAVRLKTYAPLISRWEHSELDWTVWVASLHLLGMPADWRPTKH